jgi:hypothetical protein
MPLPELEHLRKASARLLYPSETDAPFDVIHWGPADAELTPASIAGRVKKRTPKVKEIPFDEFFTELEETPEAERFGELRRAIESHLEGVRVFRVGEVEIDVFVVGRTKSGHWAGLHTLSVETG